MSTIKADTLSNLAGTQTVPVSTVAQGTARAWVNFDGATTVPTIRANFNVSSVTRRATGRYTLNFATAMSDVNYAPVFGGRNNADGFATVVAEDGTQASQAGKTTTSLDVMHAAVSYVDASSFYVAIFR